MATTYISRTPSSGGNRRTFTFSAWVKRGSLGDNFCVFSQCSTSTYNNTTHFRVRFGTTSNLQVSAFGDDWLYTNRVFRDVAAWYHIVLAVDTTNSTADQRARLYINGIEETSFSTRNNPSLNFDTGINLSGSPFLLGADDSSVGAPSAFFDGEMSHVHLIDGTACLPTVFGETDATDGMWKIKTSPSVTYGTNGFFLKMEDSSNLDLDSSSNGHTFSTTGTLTATNDNPSNNFTTGSSILRQGYPGSITIANGNTKITDGGSDWTGLMSTLGVSNGKWYAEFKRASGTNSLIGICGASQMNQAAYNQIIGATTYSIGLQQGGNIYVNTGGPGSSFGGSYTTGDIISVALDMDNDKVYFAKNGAWATGSGAWDSTTFDAAVGAQAVNTGDDTYVFGCSVNTSGTECNFGNGYFGTTAVASTNADDAGIGSFEYDVPSGFYALCTKNIKAYG